MSKMLIKTRKINLRLKPKLDRNVCYWASRQRLAVHAAVRDNHPTYFKLRDMYLRDAYMSRVEQLQKVQHEGLELFSRKNKDYGDAFSDYGTIGVLVRLGDKIRRAQSITSSGITLVNTESLRDTLIDLHNYSAMAVMLLDESK